MTATEKIRSLLRAAISQLQQQLDALDALEQAGTCNRTADHNAVRTNDAAPLRSFAIREKFSAPPKAEVAHEARTPRGINFRNKSFYERET